MSLIRKALLAMSTSTFLREQATKRSFVRKSVSAFMPGEKIEDAIAAAATLKPQKINTILTRLGEGVTRLDEACSSARFRSRDEARKSRVEAALGMASTVGFTASRSASISRQSP